MWNRPRDTIRALAFNKPSYGVYYLAIIYALQGFFFYANWWSLGVRTHYSLYLTVGVLASPIMGIGWLYITSFLFYLLGKLFKGVATMKQIRAALAWSSLPFSITLFMWLLLLFWSPEHVFIQDSGPHSSIFINFITVLCKIWSLVLLVQSFREIQHFSLKVSLLNVFILWVLSWILFFFAFALIRPVVI